MKNRLTLGVYGNKQIVFNVVRPEDLASHIEYNKAFRFGRLLYVDGKRVYGGCIKEEYLGQYDKVAEEFYSNNTVNINQPTIPYR